MSKVGRSVGWRSASPVSWPKRHRPSARKGQAAPYRHSGTVRCSCCCPSPASCPVPPVSCCGSLACCCCRSSTPSQSFAGRPSSAAPELCSLPAPVVADISPLSEGLVCALILATKFCPASARLGRPSWLGAARRRALAAWPATAAAVQAPMAAFSAAAVAILSPASMPPARSAATRRRAAALLRLHLLDAAVSFFRLCCAGSPGGGPPACHRPRPPAG